MMLPIFSRLVQVFSARGTEASDLCPDVNKRSRHPHIEAVCAGPARVTIAGFSWMTVQGDVLRIGGDTS